MANKVVKRNDATQDFDLTKIENAIRKANESVDESVRMSDEQQQKVVQAVQKSLEGFDSIPVESIQDIVEKSLMKYKFGQDVAKAYILYRDEKKKQKKFNTIESKALSLTKGTSSLKGDNANKHTEVNSSMRDYLAGLVCKSIAGKTLPKYIIKAHDLGWIHYHDMDYSPFMPMHNCDLIDIFNMLMEGFQMGDTHIDRPKKFSTACNLIAQISLIVSGSQYGGQTISWAALLPFVESTREEFRKEIIEEYKELGVELTPSQLKKLVEIRTKKDIHIGIKTYQYQILCHHSSNGQTPFVSNNLCLREAVTKQELDDFAFIIEEILNRRLKGVKDKSGHYTSPLFPKLLYWMCDGLNVKEDDPYFYLTELAAKCIVNRCQPDVLSERESRRIKEGQIIPCMGCRSFLAPVWVEKEYDISEKFYWVYNTDNKKDYPYGTFVNAASFEEVPIGKYKEGKYAINFRGNTGWLIERTEDKVIIKEPKVYGRFNEGVITLNLAHIGLSAAEEFRNRNVEYANAKEMGVDVPEPKLSDIFYRILDERLEICHAALLTRHESVSNIVAKNSPILWMYGGLARLDSEASIGDLIKSQKNSSETSISLGYAGLYETCMAIINKSNTSKEGKKFSKEVLKHMNDVMNTWKDADHLGYSIYGTPEESLTYKFALANRRDFGLIEHITDKDYVVNSYHVDPREEINAWDKLSTEGEYLALSPGGAVSYIETGDLRNNYKAIVAVMQYMYEHILYAEVNTTMGVCYECDYKGFFKLTKNINFTFTCPRCGNNKDDRMSVKGRVCGYLGELVAGNTNPGRLDDYIHRVFHLL